LTRRTRSRLASLALAASSLALIATSPGSPVASATVAGDVGVDADRPGRIVLRFEYDGSGPGTPTDLSVRFVLPESGEVVATLAGTVGSEEGRVDGTEVVLPATACVERCTIDATASLAWPGPPGRAIRVDWSAEVRLVFGSASGPTEVSGMTASVLEGGPAPVPKLGWLGLGAVLASVVAVLLARLGDRYRQVRLALAAGMAVVFVIAGVRLIVVAASVGYDVPMTMELAVAAAVLLALLVIVAVVLARLVRGSSLELPVVGWLYASIAAVVAWVLADASRAYRPEDLVAVAFVVGVPAAAAVTARPLLARDGAHRHAAAAVIAAQGVLMTAAGLVILPALPSIIGPAAVAEPSGLITSLPFTAIPGLAFLLLAVGVRRWLEGRRGTLVIMDFLLLVPSFFAFAVFFSPDAMFGEILAARLPILAVIIAALIGGFGGLMVGPPPPASPRDEDRHEERGKGEQIGGIGGEPHLRGAGQGT
jgi:hypothetical protein